jgi:hypothetical protein
VYYLTYDRPPDHRQRITPADAERVRWNSLDHHRGIAYGDGRIATEIVLWFARHWRFRGEFHFSHTVRLVRCTHRETLRRICASRRIAVAVSFAMGGHHRLGNASVVQLLDDNLARMVVSFL